jgi:hypothetical protein
LNVTQRHKSFAVERRFHGDATQTSPGTRIWIFAGGKFLPNILRVML